jgi:CBS domain-containing protein
MKQLKSSLRDLREIFERSITVKDIAEPLASFDVGSSIDDVHKFMDINDYDVIGVRKDGLIVGYAKKSDLLGGKLARYSNFKKEETFLDTAPLINVFEAFQRLERIFVFILGEVGGIVTRGDLQKSPVRMWLFGLISLIEMHLLRIIREYYPEDNWVDLIKKDRLDKAKKLLGERQRRNVAIDLADCLQFCDKRVIILRNKEIQGKLCVSKASCESFLEDIEKLRNNLAHAQDIITGNWPDIIDLARNAEEFLQKCQKF